MWIFLWKVQLGMFYLFLGLIKYFYLFSICLWITKVNVVLKHLLYVLSKDTKTLFLINVTKLKYIVLNLVSVIFVIFNFVFFE